MSLDNLSEIGILNLSMRKISSKNAAQIAVLLKAVLVQYGRAVDSGQATFTKTMGLDAPDLCKAVIKLEMLMVSCGTPISQPVLASVCRTWKAGGISDEAMSAVNLVRLETFYRQRRNG